MDSQHQPSRWRGAAVPALLVLLALLNLAWAWAGCRYGRHWYRFLFTARPRGVILHHSASDGYRDGRLLDVAALDRDHALKGWGVTYHGRVYHVAYHYVILADGAAQPGRPEGAPGAHTAHHNDYLGICLLGNFSSSDNADGHMQPAVPTRKQLDALLTLLRRLMDEYDFEPADLHRHRDFGQTACPGDRFPFAQVVAAVGGTGRARTGVDSGGAAAYNAAP